MARQVDAGAYEILFDQPKGEYRAAEGGDIRTRTIRAGDTIEVEAYPVTWVGERARAEANARRTGPAQAKLNRRNAEKRVRRLLEANFGPEDYLLTPTWDYQAIDKGRMSHEDALKLWEKLGLPEDEEAARRALGNYIRRIKHHMKRAGHKAEELKYLYVMEVTCAPKAGDPNPLPAHYHFHMAIHAPGLSRDALEALWPYGYNNADRLNFRNNGLKDLAGYITKQPGIERADGSGRRVRRWAGSKNLEEPTVTVSNRKISRRRAAMIAADVRTNGREIFEKLYPGYQLMEDVRVTYSDFVAGAYIFARLRKRDDRQPWERARRRRD